MATQSRGSDWRHLLNQRSAASVVLRKSPFTSKPAGFNTASTTQTLPGNEQQQQQHDQQGLQLQEESVIPILSLKVTLQEVAELKPDRCKDPLQQLKQLQEVQQLTSSLLAAAAELAKQAKRSPEQQQHDTTDTEGPHLRRPLPPPQHAQQDELYFWSGSRTSPCSQNSSSTAEAGAAAVAATDESLGGAGAPPAADSNAHGPLRSTHVEEAVSMETSLTTTRLPSARSSDMFSTARSPASASQGWGPALTRLKQLQLETLEALKVQ